jgi:CRISPR-associated endoribonuclease cas2
MDEYSIEKMLMADEDETVFTIDSKIKYTVLVIYDITDNKQRLKLAKYLMRFGHRVQKSAFEAKLNKKLYDKMMAGLKRMLSEEDNVRIYKLHGSEEITVIGSCNYEEEDIIII